MTQQQPSAYRIEQAVAALQAARDRMRSEGISEEDITAALGDETATVEASLAGLLRFATWSKAQAEAVRGMMQDLQARRERFDRRAQDARAVAFALMEVLDLSRLDLPDMTVSIRPGMARAVVFDDASLPDRFVTIKREPNRDAILAALKQGEDVAGASLSNGLPTLQVRTK